MSKKHLIHILTVLAVFVSSCQTTEFESNMSQKTNIVLSRDEFLSLSNDNTITSISQEEIKELLNSSFLTKEDMFFSLVKERTRSVVTKDSLEPSMLEKYTSNNLDGLYISTDSRYPKIVAYIPVDTMELNPMLELAKDNVINCINEITLKKDSVRQRTLKKVSNYFDIDETKIDEAFIAKHINVAETMTRATPINNIEGKVIQRYGPLLETKWDTGTPYSNNMPSISCSELWWTNKYPVAVIAVAAAQILSYFEPTMVVNKKYIDWGYLKEKEEIIEPNYFNSGDSKEKREMIAELMKECSDKCKIIYSCSNSKYSMNDVRNFLNSYGIIMDSESTINIDQIKKSLSQQKIVLCKGTTAQNGGHSWLLDGYYSVEANSVFYDYDFYVHANMCRGKSGTGFYLIGKDNKVDFETGFATFPYSNVKIYANIRRK